MRYRSAVPPVHRVLSLLTCVLFLAVSTTRAQNTTVVVVDGEKKLRHESFFDGVELETYESYFGNDADVMSDVLDVAIERSPHERFQWHKKITDGLDNACEAAAENMYEEVTGRGTLPEGYDIRQVGTLGTLTNVENYFFASGEDLIKWGYTGDAYDPLAPPSYAHSLNVVKTPDGDYFLVDNWQGGIKTRRVFPIDADATFFSENPDETDVRNATHRLSNLNKRGRSWDMTEEEYEAQFDGPLRDYSKEVVKDDPPRSSEQVEVEVLTSADPNDKLGLLGVGAERFITPHQPLPYLIRFENMPDASAPAQEVLVRDTLDADVFDLATFELGEIRFGERRVPVPPGRRAFSTRVPLDDRFEVLITAGLAEATGIVTWRFTTIDRETGDLPFDPLDGFLPPNQTAPEGEGSVAFTIHLLPDMPSGTVIRNQARIIFDLNEPIDTPVWRNVIDTQAPTSAVSSVSQNTRSDSVLTIRWGGSDPEGAGIQSYDVYLSMDGGPFNRWLRFTDETQATLLAENGRTYAFYSIAQDRAGNVEPPKTAADASTTVVVSNEDGPADEVPATYALWQNYPNPFNPSTTLAFDLPEPTHVRLTIYDVLGRRVALLMDEERPAGRFQVDWDASRLPSGTYLYRLETAGFTATRTLTLVK